MLTGIFGDRTRQRKYSSIAKGKLLCIADLHSFFPEDRLRARKLDYKSGAGKLHELARRR